MPVLKKQELKKKDKEELLKQLEEYKTELSSLRVEQVTGGSASKVASISSVRKAIARVHTFIRKGERDALKAHFAGKKYVPLDLRAKKTRAIRKSLTKHEKSLRTERQKKKAIHFPKRVYALKA